MSSNTFQFKEEQFNKLFPFYIKIGADLIINGLGKGIEKLLPQAKSKSFPDIFSINRPLIEAISFETLKETTDKLVMIKINTKNILLRGSFEYLEQNNEILFVGSGWFNSIEEVKENGLNLNDFAIHDPVLDMLHMLKTHEMNTKDISELFVTVNKQRNELKNLSVIVEETTNSIITTDIDNQIDWTNKAFETNTGYSINELQGKDFIDLLTGDETDKQTIKAIKEKIAKNEPFEEELITYTKNGSIFWVNIKGQALFNQFGKFIKYFFLVTDISERKKGEEALKQSEQKWKFALDGSGYGTWELDVVNRQTNFSNQFKDFLLYGSDEEFNYKEWRDAIHPDDYKRLLEIFASFTPDNPSINFEHRLRNKQGIYKYFLARGKVLSFTEANKPSKIIGTVFDINERIVLEEELKTQAERLVSLISNLHDAVLVENEDRKIVLTNDRFCELFTIPLSPEALTGMDCSQSAEQSKHLFRYPEKFVEGINKILKEKQKVKGEMLEMEDGRILERDYVPIYINNNYAGHLWKYNDVTEKVKADIKIEDQKNFYEKILNEIPADIAIFSKDHTYLFVNKLGFKDPEMRKWMIGRDDYDYVKKRNRPIEIADERRKLFNSVIERRVPQRWIDEVKTPNGDIEYVLRIFSPYINEDNEIELVIGYGINITEQRKNELEIAIEKERINELLEVINDGIFRFNYDGEIIFKNKAFSRIIKNAKETADTNNIFELVHADNKKEFVEKIKEIKNSSQPQKGILRLDNENQALVQYIDYYLAPTPKIEQVNAIAGRFSDVTEAILREQNLEQIIKKEKELNDLKSRFIRITSHELRTPLSVIMSSAEILEMFLAAENYVGLKEVDGDYTRRIIREVNRMTEILSELMMVSKIETGNINFNPALTNISEYIAKIKQELYQPFSDGRELETTIELKDELTFLDKNIFRHAITNLLNNAFKYSVGKKAPSIKIFDDNNNIFFEVRDYGIGIPEEELAFLTNSFFRASNVGSISGTGLGLMVADYTVKRHDGRLIINSTINQGSTFTIVLPKKHNTIYGQE